jgi:hypothetical protein
MPSFNLGVFKKDFVNSLTGNMHFKWTVRDFGCYDLELRFNVFLVGK